MTVYKFFIYIFIICLANGEITAAVDEEFSQLGVIALRQRASFYKRESVINPNTIKYSKLNGSDTDALIKAAYSHDLSDFTKLIKGAFKKTFNTWIDGLLPDDGDILVFEPALVVNAPASKSKADFKAAFAKVIDDCMVGKLAPANASMKSLLDTAVAVHTELSDASTKWLKSIAIGVNPQYTGALRRNNFILNFSTELAYDKLF